MLILGHRLSEWCGHGPYLEEDIALANIALDCVGQAANILALAGEIEGQGRDADALAYRREAIDFRSKLLVEQDNGDFGRTIARQFLFDVYAFYLYQQIKESSYRPLADVAEKSLKEITYHLRHSTQWVVRLGDGTEESHRRIQQAFEDLWTFTGEFFESDDTEQFLVAKQLVPNSTALRESWQGHIRQVFQEATLTLPSDDQYMATGSSKGMHSEHLGYILAEMQILPRSYPDAVW